MQFTPSLQKLIDSFRGLPGVGNKSAQRMAFHLLQHNRPAAERLAENLATALEKVGSCVQCRMFAENELCPICASQQRDQTLLCIVEQASDVLAIEHTGGFQGVYFVLMGHLSPIDGIGPDEIGIDILEQRLQQNVVQELILATNPTVEGEATAHYISELAKKYQISVSRIAHGIPVGSELEFIDSSTLIHAFNGRRKL